MPENNKTHAHWWETDEPPEYSRLYEKFKQEDRRSFRSLSFHEPYEGRIAEIYTPNKWEKRLDVIFDVIDPEVLGPIVLMIMVIGVVLFFWFWPYSFAVIAAAFLLAVFILCKKKRKGEKNHD